MPVEVLHVCDKFGVKGSSIHGVSRLFSWWLPRYDPARFRVSLCGLKKPEPASELLASQAIAVSGSTRDFLVRERFVPAEKVRLIWNGAPLDEFAPVPRDRARAVRRALGLAEDALVVGSVSRLSHQKGHRYLIDAAARVLA